MSKLNFIFYLLIGLFLLGAIAGCSSEVTTSTGTGGGREYCPNTDGYRWEYNVSFLGLSGTATYAFNGSTMVNGLSVQRWKIESTLGSTSETLVRVTDSDVKMYGTLASPTTDATTYLVFPLKVGSKWTTSGTFEATVLSQEDVTVPAGTFKDCFKIGGNSSTGFGYYWMAKNAGLVKMVSLMAAIVGTVETTVVTTMELSSKNF